MDDPFIQRTDERSPDSPIVSDDPAGTGRADGLGLAARIVLVASAACLALGLLALLAAQAGVTGYLDVVSEAELEGDRTDHLHDREREREQGKAEPAFR